jgi:hypothetical protein
MSLKQLEKLLYPVDEGADLLGVSKHVLIRDIGVGRIEVRRYGRRILIPAAEILRIAEEGLKPVELTGEASTAARTLQSERKKLYWKLLREEAQERGISLRALQLERAKKRSASAT